MNFLRQHLGQPSPADRFPREDVERAAARLKELGDLRIGWTDGGYWLYVCNGDEFTDEKFGPYESVRAAGQDAEAVRTRGILAVIAAVPLAEYRAVVAALDAEADRGAVSGCYDADTVECLLRAKALIGGTDDD